ncbi:hypothetical protein [Lysinibacillus sp. FSL W8-0992]|uniref:hypothetical protein n=1 Tax=Lysinibacillus sp. FSL W8-0992 TaxID=2954643 RepID=UPI0030FA04EF
MIRIGVIVAHNSLQDVLPIQEKLKERCELTFFTYRKLSEIKPLYLENYIFFDAIVMNGLAHLVLQSSQINYQIPTHYYMANERDFYKKLFHISRKYPNIDFSKVTFDFSGYTDLIKLEEIYAKDEEAHIIHLPITDNFYEDLLDKHIELNRSGKVELSITAFSNILNKLSEHGVTAELITASPQTIQEIFEKVIQEVRHKQLTESIIAIGKITSDALIPSKVENVNTEFNQILLHTTLLEYREKNHLSMIIQKQSVHFEIFTSQKELLTVTNNFSHDGLEQTLTESLPFPVTIGWGVGQSIDDARKKAHIANHEAQKQEKSSCIITENGQIIAPNTQEKMVLHIKEETPELQRLSEKLNISMLLMQKILSVIEKMNTNELSSDDIALHLGITIRSSNRILNELEEKGVAELIYKKHEKLRGRPKKFYKINFHKNEA